VLTNIIFKYRFSDTELLIQGKNLDRMANSQQTWKKAQKFLKKAKTRYESINKNKETTLLDHGRFALSLRFFIINSSQMRDKFNYSKKIFKKYNSTPDLHDLGLKAEYVSKGFNCQHDNIMFLKYAQNLFINLEEKEDIERLETKINNF